MFFVIKRVKQYFTRPQEGKVLSMVCGKMDVYD